MNSSILITIPNFYVFPITSDHFFVRFYGVSARERVPSPLVVLHHLPILRNAHNGRFAKPKGEDGPKLLAPFQEQIFARLALHQGQTVAEEGQRHRT